MTRDAVPATGLDPNELVIQALADDLNLADVGRDLARLALAHHINQQPLSLTAVVGVLLEFDGDVDGHVILDGAVEELLHTVRCGEPADPARTTAFLPTPTGLRAEKEAEFYEHATTASVVLDGTPLRTTDREHARRLLSALIAVAAVYAPEREPVIAAILHTYHARRGSTWPRALEQFRRKRSTRQNAAGPVDYTVGGPR